MRKKHYGGSTYPGSFVIVIPEAKLGIEGVTRGDTPCGPSEVVRPISNLRNMNTFVDI